MRGRGRPPRLSGVRRYPNRLRDLRLRRGLSQRAVADAAGISGAYYGALERGDKRINADTAGRLAGSLGCALGDVFAGVQAVSVPLTIAVAAAEAEGRPSSYDLPAPYERVQPRLTDAVETLFAAEIFDDSADLDFARGTVLFVRPTGSVPGSLAVGARVLARFFLDAAGADGAGRATHEILYGVLDRNIVGDLVLITRTSNRLVPRHLLIQNAAPRGAGSSERVATFSLRNTAIAYAPRSDDPAELLGAVVYAMGPI